jgi:hypothetical protein
VIPHDHTDGNTCGALPLGERWCVVDIDEKTLLTDLRNAELAPAECSAFSVGMAGG